MRSDHKCGKDKAAMDPNEPNDRQTDVDLRIRGENVERVRDFVLGSVISEYQVHK